MRSRTRTLACGLVVLGLMLLSTGTALAGGGGGSAGNSQYVDPLSSHTPTGHHKTTSTGTTAGTPSSTSTTTGSSTLSQSAPSSVASSPGTTSSTGSSGKTLPFTGLDLWACVGLGLGLLVVGLALRRTLARMY